MRCWLRHEEADLLFGLNTVASEVFTLQKSRRKTLKMGNFLLILGEVFFVCLFLI